MRGPRRSGKLPMIENAADQARVWSTQPVSVGSAAAKRAVPDGGSADEYSAPMSDIDAYGIAEAHHHGETCTCNLRGE